MIDKTIYKKFVLPVEGSPVIRGARDDRYLAIGKSGDTLVTVVFEYENSTAYIVTAYRSSEWQKRIYKNRRG